MPAGNKVDTFGHALPVVTNNMFPPRKHLGRTFRQRAKRPSGRGRQRRLRRKGDVIIKVNDLTVTQAADFDALFGVAKPGDALQCTVLRDGGKVEMKLKLVR